MNTVSQSLLAIATEFGFSIGVFAALEGNALNRILDATIRIPASIKNVLRNAVS